MAFTAEQRAEYNAEKVRSKTTRQGDVFIEFGDVFAEGIANPERRAAASDSLRVFCETYGKGTFKLAWSESHLKAIERIEAAILTGEQLALAMPRGSGKTALCRWAAIWAIANGHSPYVMIIAASEAAARKMLKDIKIILRANVGLFEDYPELCAPIRHLRNEARRANSQHCGGEETGIQWAIDRVVTARVPVPWCRCSEAVIDVAGITGEIRGRSYTRQDGEVVRPTVAIVDDPQTRGSARSESDTQSRLETINGDVQYLAGPEDPVGVVIPCTVIRGGDLADQILNRDENPHFHGIRTRFFESMPSDAAMKLWQGEYSTLLRRAMRADEPPVKATEFYIANREKMDEGCVPSWAERYYEKKGEISAVQRGMNAYLANHRAFQAEYQNEPEDDVKLPPVPMLDEQQFARKISNLAVGVVPNDGAQVVAFIDVHDTLLYWVAASGQNDFTGGPIAKGVYPEQPTRDFTLRSAKRTLQDVHPGSVEAAITGGLRALTDKLCSRRWKTADEKFLDTSLVLVDTGHKPEQVAAACLGSPHKVRLIGSKGLGFSPDAKPMTEYDMSPARVKKYGPDKLLPRWYVPKGNRFDLDVVNFDKTYWHSALHARFVTADGEPSCWNLWGDRDVNHDAYISHLLGKMPKEKIGKSRSVILWEPVPSREDHWLDCSIGCLVGLSVVGCRLPDQSAPMPEKKKRMSLSAMQRTR